MKQSSRKVKSIFQVPYRASAFSISSVFHFFCSVYSTVLPALNAMWAAETLGRQYRDDKKKNTLYAENKWNHKKLSNFGANRYIDIYCSTKLTLMATISLNKRLLYVYELDLFVDVNNKWMPQKRNNNLCTRHSKFNLDFMESALRYVFFFFCPILTHIKPNEIPKVVVFLFFLLNVENYLIKFIVNRMFNAMCPDSVNWFWEHLFVCKCLTQTGYLTPF